MATWKDRTEQIIIGLAANWVAPLIIAVIFVAWNWFSSGTLIRALGGITKSDLEEITKQATSSADFQVELVNGDWSVPSAIDKEKPSLNNVWVGSADCPKDTVLISAYCTANDDSIARKAHGAIQQIGFNDGKFYCSWVNTSPSEVFHGVARPVCLKFVRK